MESDARSIEQTLDGHPDAFADLVRKYQDRLFTALVHATSDSHLAEEITQESFVTAFVKLSSFRQASGFYTWLYRIAFNLLATDKRRQRGHLSVERDLTPHGHEVSSPGADACEDLAARDRALALTVALNRLSSEHRRILVLRELEGFDYDHIADILNVAIGTVRSRLHRAREQLRNSLLELEEKLY